MKITVIVALIIIWLPLFSQTQTQINFEKVANEEFEKRESSLLKKRKEVERFFVAMLKDSVVTFEEMRGLQKNVASFEREKEKFDKELRFFNKKTNVRLPAVVTNILNIYFGHGYFHFGDTEDGKIRRMLIAATGHNIVIKGLTLKRVGVGLTLGVVLLIIVIGVASISTMIAKKLNRPREDII